jgi:hypothetical protein
MIARLRGSPDWRILVFLLALEATSCATLNISPIPPGFPEGKRVEFRDGSLRIEAYRMAEPAEYARIFDDDLTDAGITAVWISVENRGPSTCNLEGARWNLRVSGQSFKRLESRQVLDRYYKQKQIRAYGFHADSVAVQKLESISLNPVELEPGQRGSGLIFFRLPAPPLPANLPAVLQLRGLRACGQAGREIELVLEYAHPRS